MRKWVLSFLLIILMLFAPSVRAQNPITLSSSQVQIWPEYDKPGVLVIYRMALPSSIIFPVTLSIRIPAAAGDPNAVAVRQVDGTLLNTDYTRQVSGEWATISFTTTAPEIQLEYYDPTLEIEGDARHYQYVWPGDYAVDQFIIQVQQPAGATNMRISPSLGTGATGSDNLVYYTEDISAIPVGQIITINIDYNKSTDTLSAENLPVEPSAPIPQSNVSNLNISNWLPWILGILGAGLIIGGIIWFWQSGKQRPSSKPRRRRSKTDLNEPGQTVSAPREEVYCSQCGKRASPGDVFCRSCGTQIRNK
jgi:hypothetical protein